MIYESYSKEQLLDLIREFPLPLSIRDLVSKRKSGNLNKPGYQRGLVWSNSDKERLISDILLGRLVPALILHPNPKPGKPNALDILDGQQRLNAICDYENGVFTPKGLAPFAEISDQDQENFLNYKFFIQFFVGSKTEAEDRYYIMNENSKKLTLGENLRARQAKIPGFESLKFLAAHPIFAGGKRSEDWKWAAHLLLNAGETLYADNPTKLKFELSQIPVEEAEVRFVRLKTPLANASKIIDVLKKKYNTPSGRIGTWAVQIAIAYLGLPELTLEGPQIIADEFANINERLSSMGKKTGTHPLNFLSTETKLSLEGLRGLISEDTFRDVRRDFTKAESVAVVVRDKELCGFCKQFVHESERHIHHVRPHASGGRTEISNGLLVHKSCHEIHHANGIELEAQTA